MQRMQEAPGRSLRRWSDALQRDIDIPASALWSMACLAYEVDSTLAKEARTPELEAWLLRVQEAVVEVVGAADWVGAVRVLQIPDRSPRSLAVWAEGSGVEPELRKRLKCALEAKSP